jgi:protein TonB
MSAPEGSLRLDERLKAEDLLFASMSHAGEGRIKWIAFTVAIVIHIVILLINFPEFKKAVAPQKRQNVIIVKKYVPPPPKVERKQVVKKKLTRKVPIPDPTPDEPEPIREPEPDIEPEPLPPDVEFLIGVPEPPPPSGPLIAGVGDVTNPVLIPESKVEPEYPELARVARLEGNVILQAIIHSDGSVGEIEVLRSNRPNMGFEEAAVEAVTQWTYKPALQNGRPVEVYFTVFVEFKLH